MIVIIDYGLGNIRSLINWFKRGDIEVVLSKDLNVISKADTLILPGVGAFRDAITSLDNKGISDLIKAHVLLNKPLIGICLGMQLLYEGSLEYGNYKGLGLLEGKMVPFQTDHLKVPHMGWNSLNVVNDFKTFENQFVYFVHSYYSDSLDNVLAYVDYGVKVPAVVRKKNVLGFQFHPEKSGLVGENLLTYLKEFINDYISSN